MKQFKLISAVIIYALISSSPSCASVVGLRHSGSGMIQSARRSYAENNVQQAIDIYWHILEKNPGNYRASFELGDIYRKLGMYDRAIELIEPAVRSNERNLDKDVKCKYFCALTYSYMKLGNEGKANQCLIKAAQASPKDPRPRVLLGDIYKYKGKQAGAAKAYKQALRLDPTCELAKERLEELLKGNKTLQNALIAAEKKAEEKRAAARRAAMEAAAEAALAEKQLAAEEEEASYSEDAYESHESQEMSEDTSEEDFKDKYLPKEVNPEDLEETDLYYSDLLVTGQMKDKERAAAYMAHRGEDGVYMVEELLYNADPSVRIIAVRTLARFSEHKKKVKSILTDAEDDEDRNVAAEVKAILSTMEDIILDED